jgi:YesN/AraC family two-component response regulator
MDIEMPGKYGIEASKLVKAFSATGAVQLSKLVCA